MKFDCERFKKKPVGGRIQEANPKQINLSFTRVVPRNMSPVSYKFLQTDKAPQYPHGAPQLHTLIEMVAAVRATLPLRPGSTQLPSERAAALLKTACSAFCTPCLSGGTSL